MAGAPIDVARNSFYRKHDVTSDGAVNMLPALPDAALTGTPDFTLDGGAKANVYLISGAVPASTNYGGGELVGGDLVLYCSGVNTSTSGAPPSISVYSAVSGGSFTEGAMELSHGWESLSGSGSNTGGADVITGTGTTFLTDFKPGDDIKINDDIAIVASITNDTSLIVTAVIGDTNTEKALYKPRFYGNELAIYTAHADKDVTTYSEGFDGDTSLGQIKIPGYKATNPYVDLGTIDASRLASKLYAGGNYSITYDIWAKLDSGTEVKEGIEYFREYFGTNQDGSRNAQEQTTLPTDADLDPVTSIMPKDFLYLKPYDDNKPDDIWVPKNDYRSGIEHIIAFTPMWRWKDIKGIVRYEKYEADDVEQAEDVNPNNTIFDAGLIYSSPSLSSFYGGGDVAGVPVNKSIIQLSTETYHSGGQSLNMYHLWSYSQLMGKIDTQYGTTGSANAQYACVGMANVPFPQVIDNAWCARNETETIDHPSYVNAALPEVNVRFNIKEMGFVPEIHSSKGTSATTERGVVTDYMCANLGAATPANGYAENSELKHTTSGSYNKTLRTLARNFTILFSNYPPDEGEGLDDFLHRGLKNYYSGSSADFETYRYFVGGMTVFRSEPKPITLSAASVDHGAYSFGNGDCAIAMPLGTGLSSYAQAMPNSATTGSVLIDEYWRNRLFRFQNASGNTAQGANLMCFGGIPANPGTPASGGAGLPAKGLAGGFYEDSVPIQMDQFVNVKFVFDPLGVAYATTGSAITDTGVQTMCRAYFTEGVFSSESNAVAETTSAASEQFTESIPIYFPTQLSDISARTMVSFMNEPYLWPRYMTLWVTNMRQTNNTSASVTDLEGETQPWSSYTSDMCNFGLGVEEEADGVGSDKQVNVFVDSITMSNFTNSVSNASARGGGATENILLNQYPMQTSSVPPEDSTGLPYSWKISQQLGVGLSEVYMPTYLLMGYDNGPADFYNGYTTGGAGTTQWYQMHGFGSQSRDKLKRQGKATTLAFASNGSGTVSPSATAEKYYGNWLYSYHMLSGAYQDNPSTLFNSVDGGSWAGNYCSLDVDYNGASLPDTSNFGEFNFASGSSSKLFTDGITQKGFFLFGQTADTGSTSWNFADGWVKREHPFVASKITKIPSLIEGEPNEGNTVTVDNIAIFNMPLSDEYIIYSAGNAYAGYVDAYNNSSDTYNYTTIGMSSLAPSGNIGATDTTVDLLTSDAEDYYTAGEQYTANNDGMYIKPGNYITTGAYLALISSSTVKEIVKVESFIRKGKSSTYDKMTISRGRMGTSAAARTSAAHTFELVHTHALKGVTLTKAREGSDVTFDVPDLDCLVNNNKLPYLYVSPYKYWHWFQIWPGQKKSGNSAEVYVAAEGTDGSAKAYTGISMMKDASATTTSTGSTYSERLYTWDSRATGSTQTGMGAPYFNIWNLMPASTGSFIDSNTNFGLGSFDPEQRVGSEITIQQAVPDKPIAFNLDGFVRAKQPSGGHPIINKVNLTAPLASSSAVFYGNDYSTVTATTGLLSGSVIVEEDVKPYYLWRYFDSLPEVDNFTVSPAFDVLSENTDLYKLNNEDLSGIRFTWDESGEDVWYRMLIVDRKAIYNKYAGISGPAGPLFYAPLNDKPTTMIAKPTLTFNDTTTDSMGKTFSPTVAANGRMSPEGFQGYGYDCGVSGTAGITIGGTDSKMMEASSGWTFIAHVIPAEDAVATSQYIFKKNDSAAPFSLYMDGAGYVRAILAGGTTLSSVSTNPKDGTVPIMIAVQYDADGKMPCKLFINGKLEDFSLTGTTNMSAVNTASYIGTEDVSSDSTPWKGIIEEVILYGNPHVYFPDDSGEFLCNPTGDLSFTGTEPSTVHAKLFIMDYHNIRGKTKEEICQSPAVSWRTTIA